MNLKQFHYVLAVAEERSFTVAAQKLFVSQSGLSQYIAKLETQLGQRLFDRNTSPVELTDAGRVYVQEAREILLRYTNLRDVLQDVQSGARGRVVVGMPQERAGYMLSRVLAAFRQQYPKIDIRLVENNGKRLMAQVDQQEVDFVVLPLTEGRDAQRYNYSLIYSEELVVVSVEPLRGAVGQTIALDWLLDHNFVLVRAGHAIRARCDQLFFQAGFEPKVLLETESNLTSVQLALSGFATALVPRRAVEVLKGVKHEYIYSLSPQPVLWDVCAISLRNKYLTSAQRTLIDLMRSRFATR